MGLIMDTMDTDIMPILHMPTMPMLLMIQPNMHLLLMETNMDLMVLTMLLLMLASPVLATTVQNIHTPRSATTKTLLPMMTTQKILPRTMDLTPTPTTDLLLRLMTSLELTMEHTTQLPVLMETVMLTMLPIMDTHTSIKHSNQHYAENR